MKDEDKKANVEIVKVKDIKTKKWEPKKKVQFQTNETTKAIVKEKKLGSDTIKKIIVSVVKKVPTPSMIVKPTIFDPIDMISMLSQITIKVPLSKLFRIQEHKSKALSWLGGIGNNDNILEQIII